MIVTFQVTKEMTLEEWMDHLLGSGAFTWPWWVSVDDTGPDVDQPGLEVEWYKNADHPSMGTEKSFLTYQEIADACSEYAQESKFVANQLANDDFDADGMDRVLQYAFIGEVMYS